MLNSDDVELEAQVIEEIATEMAAGHTLLAIINSGGLRTRYYVWKDWAARRVKAKEKQAVKKQVEEAAKKEAAPPAAPSFPKQAAALFMNPLTALTALSAPLLSAGHTIAAAVRPTPKGHGRITLPDDDDDDIYAGPFGVKPKRPTFPLRDDPPLPPSFRRVPQLGGGRPTPPSIGRPRKDSDFGLGPSPLPPTFGKGPVVRPPGGGTSALPPTFGKGPPAVVVRPPPSVGKSALPPTFGKGMKEFEI